MKKLSHMDTIALAVKDATREGKSFYQRERQPVTWAIRSHGMETRSSPALVQWADCVLVIGGSIGIEALCKASC